MVPSVPVVERADDAHAFRVRRPDREADAAHALDRELVRAEEAMRVQVVAVREAREIELLDVDRERIRVVLLVPSAVEALPAQAVRGRERAARTDPLEQRGARHARELGLGRHERGALRARQQHSDDLVGRRQRMDAEDAARVVEPAGEQSFDVGIPQVGARAAAARGRGHVLDSVRTALDTQRPLVVASARDEADSTPADG